MCVAIPGENVLLNVVLDTPKTPVTRGDMDSILVCTMMSRV